MSVYCTSWGDQIPGLLRLGDGRWRISGSAKTTFTEHDERLAIARFKRLTEKSIDIPTQHSSGDEAARVLSGRLKATSHGEAYIDVPAKHDESFLVSNFQPSEAAWAYFREMLLTRRDYVAQMTGIEQIAWLPDLQRPGTSKRLHEIGELYAKKPGLSENEAGRSRLFWKEFVRGVGVERVSDITHDVVAKYEAAVKGRSLSSKSVLHRFHKIKTILKFAIKRGQGIAECRKTLDVVAMLEVKNHTPLDPKPIAPSEFWAIERKARAAGDDTFATLMLVALNCAFYSSEVADLRWDEIDLNRGELVTRRNKTKVSRVSVLWPEVIKALRKFNPQGDKVFYTSRRSYTTFSALAAWRRYRVLAGLPDSIVFSQIRDAAYTLACRESIDQARVLAGHRLPGAADHYVRRQPQFVAPACKTVRLEFLRVKNTKAMGMHK